jgi:predicted transcriptional regulator
MESHQLREVPGAYWQLRAIPFRDEDVVDEVQCALEDYLEDRENPTSEPGVNAGLIVIDTLSQFFGGGNEVEGPDMAMFVNNMRRLAQDAGVAVLVVHHSNAGGGRERGHSSLRGNVDVMFKIEGFKKDGRLLGMSLLNDKQRDNPAAPKLYVDVRPVKSGLVICPSSAEKIEASRQRIDLTDEALLDVLRSFELVESEKNETCNHTDLMEQCGLKRQRLHERLVKLKRLQLITSAGQGKSALTLLGRDAIAMAAQVKRYGAAPKT